MLRGLAPAEANLATCAPREPPATGRCRYGFPAPSALQGCFLNLPTEAFDEAFSSGGLGSASLQLDAHTHQQEQDEIERLEGRA